MIICSSIARALKEVSALFFIYDLLTCDGSRLMATFKVAINLDNFYRFKYQSNTEGYVA
jgi:hypothetical protein